MKFDDMQMNQPMFSVGDFHQWVHEENHYVGMFVIYFDLENREIR